MERVGLGGGKRREDGDGEGEVEDEVKVGSCGDQSRWAELTLLDLLHLSHTLTADAVHLGIASPGISSLNTHRNAVLESGE
jgi:hypothetical protein